MPHCQTNKHCSGHRRVIKIEDDQRTSRKEIWAKKSGQQVSGTAGGRWRWQHETEMDGNKKSVAYAPQGATRLKSSQVKHLVGLQA